MADADSLLSSGGPGVAEHNEDDDNWRPIARATVYVEVVLYGLFGVVSVWDVATWFQNRRTENTFRAVEMAYLVLSCVSKILLGSLALANTQGADYYITNVRGTTESERKKKRKKKRK